MCIFDLNIIKALYLVLSDPLVQIHVFTVKFPVTLNMFLLNNNPKN